ncbi:hypothetical protein [Bradyrhizobium roseum]|uniref:hypothetical protein n=1 Tax=Bradyrhizobium roseum TaxID=3056648 RepID=UPI0026171C4E|nr:hypothetical protein [Bradyrhizobium roseus]WKA30438.1 hypothetical protein QUH67_09850 [Bradyrhizobium roseus]
MIEANLFPAIPYLHVQQHDREVTSMSDYVHTGRRSRMLAEHRTIEYRLIFGACFLFSLGGAIFKRLTPRRKGTASGEARVGNSILKEASSAASVWVASSFMGL